MSPPRPESSASPAPWQSSSVSGVTTNAVAPSMVRHVLDPGRAHRRQGRAVRRTAPGCRLLAAATADDIVDAVEFLHVRQGHVHHRRSAARARGANSRRRRDALASVPTPPLPRLHRVTSQGTHSTCPHPNAPTPLPHPQPSKKMARRGALGSFLGSVVEYYDFFVYGTAAALVFGKISFRSASAAGTLASSIGPLTSLATARGPALRARRRSDRPQERPPLHIAPHGRVDLRHRAAAHPCDHRRRSACSPRRMQAPAGNFCRRAGRGQPAHHGALPRRKLRLLHELAPQRGCHRFDPGDLDLHPRGSLPQEQLLTWGWRIPFLLSFVMVFITLLCGGGRVPRVRRSRKGGCCIGIPRDHAPPH